MKTKPKTPKLNTVSQKEVIKYVILCLKVFHAAALHNPRALFKYKESRMREIVEDTLKKLTCRAKPMKKGSK